MRAVSYWQAVKEPLAELIERNNLGGGGKNITVQLLGGGSRVPRVRAELQSLHPAIQLEKQLVASESFAMGAGLYAANLSTTFRLRQFGMMDVAVFPIAVSLQQGEGVPQTLEVRLRAQTRKRACCSKMHILIRGRIQPALREMLVE
jgi:molecular chaperone DnaK (HSP70)